MPKNKLNELTIVIVGIGQWQEYTRPLIESIQKHEPDVSILVVDNASPQPYPHGDGYEVLRLDEKVSYAAAMNAGMNAANPSKYYMIINNDVICKAPFLGMVKAQPSDTIASNYLNERYGKRWVDGWHYCIPRRVWQKVGEFDENFKIAAFEDADFTFRAYAEGFKLVKASHPFKHLRAKTRHGQPNFLAQRLENLRYLIEKHDLKGWELW